MVRVLRGYGAVAGHEAGAQRVLTEQIVELCLSGIGILALAGELGGQTEDDAGIRNGHVAAPLELGQCHAVGGAVGVAEEGVGLLEDGALRVLISRAALVDGRGGQQGDVAVVADGGPVEAGLGRAHAAQILAVAGGTIELCGCPVALVRIGLVAVLAGGDVAGVLEDEVRVLLEEAPSLLGSSEALVCVALVIALVDLGCERHRRCEVGRRGRGDRGDDQLLGLGLGSHIAREVRTGDLVVNAAVGGLHLHHPVELVLGLIEDVGLAVAALRDADVIAIGGRGGEVGVHQVSDCLRCRYDISAVVAGIVPAAGNVDLLAGTINGRHGVVAGRVAELAALYRTAAALEIEHLHGLIQHVIIDIVADREGVGLVKAAAGDVILALGSHTGEVADLVALLGAVVVDGSAEVAGVDGLAAGGIDDGELGSAVRAANNDGLLGIRAIADLIGHDRCHVGTGRLIVDLRIVHHLDNDIVKIDGVLRERAAVGLLETAVEDELGHDVGIGLHGEGLVDMGGVLADGQALPVVGLVGTAVLLQHALNVTVRGAGDVVGQAILGVLIERHVRIGHLHGVGQLAGAADVQREAAAVGTQGRGAAGLLVHAPAGRTGLEGRVADEVRSGCRDGGCRDGGTEHHTGCDRSSDSLKRLLFHNDLPLSVWLYLPASRCPSHSAADTRRCVSSTGLALAGLCFFIILFIINTIYKRNDNYGRIMTLICCISPDTGTTRPKNGRVAAIQVVSSWERAGKR